ASLAKTGGSKTESGARDIQGEVLHAPDLARRGTPRVDSRLVGEDGQQAAIARIEVQVILVRLAQIRLLEDEGHPQRAFPEINRALPGRSDNGDVMQALDLNHLLHGSAFALRASARQPSRTARRRGLPTE